MNLNLHKLIMVMGSKVHKNTFQKHVPKVAGHTIDVTMWFHSLDLVRYSKLVTSLFRVHLLIIL